MSSPSPEFDVDTNVSEVDEDEAPLVAVPSRAESRVRESSTDRDGSTSEAFELLDKQLSEGRLGGDRVANLKAKYIELLNTLKATRDHETALIQQAKEYTQRVAVQQAQLEKADRFGEGGDTSEVAQLRHDLLAHVNEFSQSEERYEKLKYDICLLKEDKKESEREYSRTLKPEDLEQRIKDLNKANEDFKSEIAQRTQEAKQLQEEIGERQRLTAHAGKEMDESSFRHVKLKDDFVKESTAASAVFKQLEVLTKSKQEIEEQKRKQKEFSSQLDEQICQSRERQQVLRTDLDQSNDMIDQHQRMAEALDRDYQQYDKEYRLQCERRDISLGDKATLDMNFQHVNVEYKLQHESHARCLREKDRELKNVKRGELQLKHSVDSLEQIRTTHGRLSTEVEELAKIAESRSQKRAEVKEDVDRLRRQTLAQDHEFSDGKQLLEDTTAHERLLSELLKDMKELVRDGNRMVTLKTIERDQKARETHRVQSRLRVIFDDIKTKNNVIEEGTKRNKELQVRLNEYAEMYDVLKAERNKCVSHIQTTTQKAGEMREKVKILQNEVEILQASIAAKDRLAAKSHLKLTQSVMLRDSIKNELHTQQRLLDECRLKADRQVKNLKNLNGIINAAEEQMVQLRKRYEQCVQERNDRGVKLIERNEEVCIFYEKLNIQDTMLRNGDIEMQGREEEIRFATMDISELKREIESLRSDIPNKRNIEDELTTVQIQLEQCRELMVDLEAQLELPSSENARLLEGVDLSTEEMTRKIEEVEIRLADKEELLLEKELVLEEVSRLCARAKKKAETGKEDTLSLAKKVNDFQSRIKQSTRKMMAIVSELSMHQANSLQLQQSVKESESELEQCRLRMERGECPTEQIEREWKKIEAASQRKDTEKQWQRSANEEMEQYELANGVYTTAEPRPNAYIPEGDLPLPKPYGALAPFKPSEPGAAMRHLRKPVQKPIEL